jgi:dipeptide/tripeptide permease
MFVGFLLPLLRRLSSRGQALVGAAVMLFGVALAATWAGLGAGHGAPLLIRFGILFVVIGAALCVRTVMVARRQQGGHQ